MKVFCLSRRSRARIPSAILLLSFAAAAALAAAAQAADPPAGQPNQTSLPPRVPWTHSKVVGSPDPPLPYALEPLFPKLKFKEPVVITALPGTGRLLVAELSGKIFSFPNDPNCDKPDLVIDLNQTIPGFTQLYGFTVHPEFARNHAVFVCYVLKSDLPDGTHVSRFMMNVAGPPRMDPASEQVLLTFLSGGHNGGCLTFGNDHYLYISTGDGAGPNPPDPRDTGQDISDLLSSVLRIDVDHADPGKAYRVPPDNPFVNYPGARPEIWAYGFRNPWKMSIDPATGDLWVGDVGWELWELIYRVQRGGNYGWSIFEGRQPVKPQGKHGPTPILPPVVDQPHSEAASITGGHVYHGTRLRELAGSYLYGDWVTGKIWGLRYNGTNVTSHQLLANSFRQIIAFGLDENKELYILTFDGAIHRLIRNPAAGSTSTFPVKLSDTGLFTSTAKSKLAPGVVRYAVNAELWADFASAERFLALPERTQITNQEKWLFPTNAVLGKTISIEMERGNSKTRRRLETQILHFDGATWRGYTYRWNDAQTDADLVDGAGADTSVEIRSAEIPGGAHQQTWHFASRAECLRCHNPWAGPPLAFTAEQLNHRDCLGSRSDNQLERLARETYFSGAVAAEKQPHFCNPYGPAAPLQDRARVYLHVNCSHCHRENAGGAVNAVMNFELPLEKMKLVAEHPTQGNFGLADPQLISPGNPWDSVLFFRISTSGQGRMPYLGSREVDVRGVNLIADWIRSLTNNPSAAEELNRVCRELKERAARPSDELKPLVDSLLATPSGALALAEQLNRHALPHALEQTAAQAGAHRPNPLVRDLFDRFLPDDQRTLRLGPLIHPEEILARSGNATHGRILFRQEGGPQCVRCHRVLGEGREFGPDLSRIGSKYNRAQLLDQILFPSKIIDPAYLAYQVETSGDLSYAGLIVQRTGNAIVLRQVTGEDLRIPAAQIKHIAPQKLSAMPEQLLQGLTAQDAADLLEYLSSLR